MQEKGLNPQNYFLKVPGFQKRSISCLGLNPLLSFEKCSFKQTNECSFFRHDVFTLSLTKTDIHLWQCYSKTSCDRKMFNTSSESHDKYLSKKTGPMHLLERMHTIVKLTDSGPIWTGRKWLTLIGLIDRIFTNLWSSLKFNSKFKFSLALFCLTEKLIKINWGFQMSYCKSIYLKCFLRYKRTNFKVQNM